uniref:integrin alpha-1-like n=1 Tax=Pristiophorus japonicus TaxID=55135 RepID=UPI00398F777D
MTSSDPDIMHFAVVQYSHSQKLEMSFTMFQERQADLSKIIMGIELMESITLTATAIKFVIDKVFTEEAGAREGATRLLIVITDGETTPGDQDLRQTIALAENKDIVRCAIGVGGSFSPGSKAEKELEMIASSPSNLIKMKSYDDLQSIFEGLKSKINNREGGTSNRQGFTEEAGAREGATRLLIVITDGETTPGDQDLRQTIALAENKDIVRCAIGVGGSFSPGSKAEKELEMIASSPSNLIKMKSYDDLQSIFEGLKSKINNREGVHSSSNKSSFELEMSQAGFSALITEDAIAFGAVGAFDWSGGLVEFRGNTSTFINVSKAQSNMKNAYLGNVCRYV